MNEPALPAKLAVGLSAFRQGHVSYGYVVQEIMAFYAAGLAAGREAAAKDAERWKFFESLMHSSVGAGITVNDEALVYEDPDPEGIVRLYWYPVTPVGFYEMKGNTVSEAVDAAIRAGLPEKQ